MSLMPEGDPVSTAVQELESRARKMGLYLENVALAVNETDPRDEHFHPEDLDPTKIAELVAAGQEVAVMTTFAIGDVAFSQRVQDPEQFAVNEEARLILPDEAEELKEKLREATASGTGIFNLDDEDDGTDEDDTDEEEGESNA